MLSYDLITKYNKRTQASKYIKGNLNPIFSEIDLVVTFQVVQLQKWSSSTNPFSIKRNLWQAQNVQ